MSKATLEFDLPEDIQEFDLACKAHDLYAVIWDFDQYLRENVKYNPDKLKDDQLVLMEKVREELFDIMNNHSINFDMVS